MRGWRELRAIVITLAIFVAESMRTGKRPCWRVIDAQLARPQCEACLSQRAHAQPSPRLSRNHSAENSLLISAHGFSCCLSLHRVDALPAGTKVLYGTLLQRTFLFLSLRCVVPDTILSGCSNGSLFCLGRVFRCI
jgi:hypothetical protein